LGTKRVSKGAAYGKKVKRHGIIHSCMKKLALCLSLFQAVSTAPLSAESLVFEAGPERNTLVQLFTSDASAHTLPALGWMTEQARKDPKAVLWQTFVPVALHVNLWDADGYKDVFARPEFTQMLIQYRGSWKVTNVYPPTMAANGIEWSGWSRGQEPPSNRSESTGVLSIRVTDPRAGKFSASFKPGPAFEGGQFTLHACLLGFDQRSKPADGKNRGKSLQHDFIVRQYRTQGFITISGSHQAVVELPMPLAIRQERYGAAFWVTKKGGFQPLQATGGFLPL